MVNNAWLRRRFYEFRIGHSLYLAFSLSLLNFVVIQYKLLLQNVSFLRYLFPSLLTFLGMFIIVYIPIAIIIGRYIHRKKQLKIEQEIIAEANPYLHRLFNELQELRKEIKRLGEKHHE